MVPFTIPATLLTRSPANGDRTGNSGLEVQVDRVGLCSLRQFTGVVREQRLVGGYDRLAGVEGRENQLARELDSTDHLDHDVDVVTTDQGLGVRRLQFLGNSAVRADTADGNPPQFQRGADASFEFLGLLTNDPDDLAPDVAEAENGHTDSAMRRFARHCDTSKLSRSSTVSLRRITRETPSRTATTAGRVSRLYLLDIE